MGEPFVLYDAQTGESVVCAAPAWASQEVAAGRLSRLPQGGEAGQPAPPPDSPLANFSVVSGIGSQITEALHNAGVLTWADVRRVGMDGLLPISGMNQKRAADLLARAQAVRD